MTIQDNFDALAKYNTNTVLDTDLKAYSKGELVWYHIISFFCCCFGFEFPDCDMGRVAEKVHDFASPKNQVFFKNKSVEELSAVEGQINNLKIKAAKNDGRRDAVTKLEQAALLIGRMRDEKIAEESTAYLTKNPELVASLNALPPVETTIDSTQIEFGLDFVQDGADRHYNGDLPCTYQVGDGVPLKAEKEVQKELTAQIKKLFNRSAKTVTEDPLLKTIVSHLGPPSCIDLDPRNETDVIFMIEHGITPGGRKPESKRTPPHITFIASPDNPNQATIKTESVSTLTTKDDQVLYLTLKNTIVITQNPKKPTEYSVVIQRHFEPL